jgi:hypothetical protein
VQPRVPAFQGSPLNKYVELGSCHIAEDEFGVHAGIDLFIAVDSTSA